MRTKKDYIAKYNWSPIDFGEITIPKGTEVTHQTAMGIDKNYHFVADWSWYKPEVKGYARKMMLHNFEHSGINVPKEYVESQEELDYNNLRAKRNRLRDDCQNYSHLDYLKATAQIKKWDIELSKYEKKLEPPKYAMIGNTEMRLVKDGYYRDAGQWDIEFEIVEGKFVTKRIPDKILGGLPIIEISKEEYELANKGYLKGWKQPRS